MSGGRFEVWYADEPHDFKQWLSIWSSLPSQEVFAHPSYVKLYATKGNRPLCAALLQDEAFIIYPFLFRDLTIEAFWPPNLPGAFDLITPYGYGGALAWGKQITPDVVREFWAKFGDWAEEHNVISEFVRFSLFAEEMAAYPGHIEQRQQNVMCNLQQSDDELWRGFHHKVRKNVKKARSAGVVIEHDDTGARLDDFLRIYHSTMVRRDASSGYFFPREFFKALGDLGPGRFRYFHAICKGTVISTELILISASRVYSFLGGTDADAFSLRPNDLLKYELIDWARRQGKQWFVLGGGHLPNDGIYQYKLAFAPQGAVPYLVGRRVFRQDIYEALLKHRRALAERQGTPWSPTSGFFPEYRG